ncbi:unnamed protein product [Orchesella dallaii]|uniref:DNA/RNA-binding domain-containing protein n=1 Tax=Orchesella dallaii TaxID=48710 RepID=A0ABP1QD81_9HEXA
MGDSKNGEEEPRKGVQAAKKLYGSINDLGIQIDSLSSRCLDIEDLFSHDLQAKRVILKDYCENLFNICPKTYGYVAREKLWKLVLYDAIARARKMQKDRKLSALQLGLVKAHLQCGIGVLQLYVMKLKRLCSSPKDPLAMRSDVLDICFESNSRVVKNNIITYGEREKSGLTELVHICVVNIGDLYRYLKEIHLKSAEEELAFESAFYLSGAQTHYMQAFLLRPDFGLAFNQLGNLYSEIDGLYSVYYLLYSIQSTTAYEGSYSNLRHLLDRKIVQYARLPASVESRPKDTLVNNILSLTHFFMFEHTQLQNYERHCQEALTNFTERLVTSDPEVDEKFLFQLSSICVMIVWRLQVSNSVHTSAAVGFAISVFCQLVNHLATILEQHSQISQGPSQTLALSPSPVPSDVDQQSIASITGSRNRETELDEFEAKQSSSQEDGEKHGFTAPKRRKRRRRGRGISDSESEGSDYGTPDFIYTDEEELENSESDDDWEKNSEDEEIDFDGSIPDEDCEKISQKDGSEYGYKFKSSSRAFDSSSSNGNSDASVSGVQGSKPKNSANKCSEIEISGVENPVAIGITENEKQRFMIPVEDLMQCRSQIESSLVALSPFLRWIQSSSVIKDALAANVEKVFLEKMCSALNLLVSQNWSMLLDDLSLSEELKSDWKTLCKGTVNEMSVLKWELEEDRSMLGMPHFQDFLKDLKIQDVTPNDALVIRIGRMVAFGSWLVSTENFSILYSGEELNYFVPNPQTLKAYLLQSKLKRLKERLGNGKSEELDKLTKAYKDMKINNSLDKSARLLRNRNRRDDDMEPRRNRRRRGGASRRMGGSSTADPVYAVIDLEAILKRFYDVKRVAANRKFIVVIPHSAWKTLDMLKDSEEENSKNARTAFRWLEGALKRKHSGLILQKDQQKLEINFPYPKDPIDVDAWDYFDMMECCNFIIGTWLKNKPRSNEVIWGDVRDKCRVFFLTGREDLLNTRIPRSFDPVKIARNVGMCLPCWFLMLPFVEFMEKSLQTPKIFVLIINEMLCTGIFVDYIAPYPGLGRGKKWKSVAKTNG